MKLVNKMDHQRSIDLALVAGDRQLPFLSGKDRGRDARASFHFDDLDRDNDVVVIVAPDFLKSVSSSFTLGLLSSSLNSLGDRFWSKYRFSGKQSVIEQMTKALRRSLAGPPTIQ